MYIYTQVKLKSVHASFESALNNEDISSYIDAYAKFRHVARTGHLGKTAKLWVSYMDHMWLVLQLTKAVKTNNFLLYVRCLFLMCDLFFSFGGQNYARYLTFFSVFLANIEISHPGATDLLKRGATSVSRSFVTGNRCPVDKTIEESFMKHSKSHGGAGGGSAGLSDLLSNYDAYQRWVRGAHERVQFVKGALAMVDMLGDDSDAKKKLLKQLLVSSIHSKWNKKTNRTVFHLVSLLPQRLNATLHLQKQLCVRFVDRFLSFCTFSFGHCVVDIRILITPFGIF
jgi:hypothetical protein